VNSWERPENKLERWDCIVVMMESTGVMLGCIEGKWENIWGMRENIWGTMESTRAMLGNN